MTTRAEKKKLIAMGVLMAIAIPLALYNVRAILWPGHETTVTMATKLDAAAQPASQTAVSAPDLDWDTLVNSRKIVYQLGRNIFDMQYVAKKINPAGHSEPAPKIEEHPPTPAASFPVKFYGFAKKQGDQKKVFLQNGERVFIANLGSVIDRRYRVVQIEANSVLLEDLLTNNSQTIFLTTR